jgi:uncharacterized protein (TIGR00251 family)
MKSRQATGRKHSHAAAEAVLSVRIQPRASRNGIVLREGGGIKIRLTAPPVDNAANEALVRYLAETLSVSRSQVEIVTGHTSRDKIVRVSGIGQEEAERVLNQAGE